MRFSNSLVRVFALACLALTCIPAPVSHATTQEDSPRGGRDGGGGNGDIPEEGAGTKKESAPQDKQKSSHSELER